MSDICSLKARDLLACMDKKELSAVEVTHAYYKAIDAKKSLNAYITLSEDIALDQAKQADMMRQNGKAGKLCGVPIAVKDLFCTKNIRTTAASHILDNFIPPYESTITHNLWQAGAVCLGKTNLDEFAMGSSNKTSYFGAVTNPWCKDDNEPLVPGGSSGGSAAAVAANMAPLSLGTDTGGSIRQPASFCGVVGVKPTYGRCSRFGVVAFASSLDQAGPFARDVKDSALLLDSMSSFDAYDSTSSNVPKQDWLAACDAPLKGKKIGIPKEYDIDGLDDDIKKIWQQGAAWLKEQGADIIDISLPYTKYALPVYYIIAPAEASSNLARYDGVRYGLRVDADTLDELYAATRGEGFGDEVKRRILIGTYVLSSGYYDAYYRKAQSVRRLIVNDFASAFTHCDAILTPATPNVAFPINQEPDPLTLYASDVFTTPASLAGLPAMSVPCGLSRDNLPMGLQLIANKFDEATLFTAGASLERAANWQAIAPLAYV